MALSDNSEETSIRNVSEHLHSESWNTENNNSTVLSTGIVHKCFENGSMLIPLSLFPPGHGNTTTFDPDTNASIPVITDTEVHKDSLYYQSNTYLRYMAIMI